MENTLDMSTKTSSVVGPEVLEENKNSINTFMRHSYEQAKKQIESGISAFKDEFRQTAEACIDFFRLPVNNYLKDIGQIENEFRLTEALSTPTRMEENY
jgi:hypothetical protein